MATTTGDLIYVDSAHAESASSASITWNAATSGIFVSIISVNRNGSITTGHAGKLAGGSVTTGTNAFGIAVESTGAQSLYIYGITFATNSGSSGSNTIIFCGGTGEDTIRNLFLDTCTINTPGTSGTTLINFGNTSGSAMAAPLIILKDTLLKGHNSTSNAVFQVRNCELWASGLTIAYNTAKPVSMLDFSAGCSTQIRFQACDLSGYENGSGNYFIVTNFRNGFIELIDCKRSGSPGVTTGTWKSNSVSITAVNFDFNDTKTGFALYMRTGQCLSTESIYVTAGPAIESTHVGLQVVTTSACNEAEPFFIPTTETRQTGTSSITSTMVLIHDSGTNLHNQNCWLETGYVSSSTFPLGTLASTRSASLFEGSPTDLTADTTTWTGTGGFGAANKQKAANTFTPGEACTFRNRIAFGIASKTAYVNPQPTVA